MIVREDDLYAAWVELITATTGLPCWRKGRMLCNPNGAYATFWMAEGPSPVQEIIDYTATEGDNPNEPLRQKVWGTIRLDCTAEFLRDGTERALSAATKFRKALQLEARFNDIWKLCGLVGEIRTIDISGVFREDVEPRAQVRFAIYANLDPDAPAIDTGIGQIDSVELDITVDDPQDFGILKVINYEEENA